jgi:hypothetical protein
MTFAAQAKPAPAAEAPAPPSLLKRRFALLVLVVFWLYVAAMFVLALDQNLHWGLFPSAADREITAKIQQLGDPSLTKEQRDAITTDIVNWNSFSVPPLLKAVETGPAAIRDPALKILQTISLKFYNQDITKDGSDAAKLNQWWAGVQAGWAKPANDTPQ